MRLIPILIATAFCGAVVATDIILKHPISSQPNLAMVREAPSKIPAELESFLRECEHPTGKNAGDRELVACVRAIRSNPAYSDGWVGFGDALVQRSRDTLDTSLYEKVEKVYLHAHALDANNAQALSGLAWAAGSCHRFEDSVAWATLALKGNAELPDAYGILGDAAVELGRYEEASENYQKMLDLRPDMSSYSRAAHLLYIQGDVQKAMRLMEQAIRSGGSRAEHQAWCVADLSTMLCREGAPSIALKKVEEALRVAPQNPLLLAARGHALVSIGDNNAAIAAYEKAIARAPQHPALAALYDLYRAAGRPDDAARVAQQVKELHRTLQAQHISGGEGQLAMFYADTGENLPEAVRLAEIEFGHHRGPIGADMLAWCYFRAGRIKDAEKLLPKMLAHRAPDPAILFHAGMIEDAAGDAFDAKRHLYAALSREPRFNPMGAPQARATLERLGSAVVSTD